MSVNPGVRVIGADRTIVNLRGAVQSVDDNNRDLVVKGSILARNLLVKRLTGKKGWDKFWGATSPKGAYLGGRTGQTRQRISPGGRTAAYRVGTRWQASVGSPDRHVLLHDQGGTVQPPHYIPTAAAQRRSGTLKFQHDQVPGGFVWPNQKQLAGKLAGRKRWVSWKRGRRLELLFLIHDKPVVHRKRGIFDAVSRELNPQIRELGRVSSQAVVRRGNG